MLKNFILLLVIFISSFCSANAQYKKIRSGVWEGTASYYHNKFNGRLTSNGEVFSNNKMTAASNFLKLGTWVKVTNLKNGRSVVVKINDRMNKNNRRLIDMSRISAQKLGYIHAGLTKVRMEVIKGSKAEVGRYSPNEYVRNGKLKKPIKKSEPIVAVKPAVKKKLEAPYSPNNVMLAKADLKKASREPSLNKTVSKKVTKPIKKKVAVRKQATKKNIASKRKPIKRVKKFVRMSEPINKVTNKKVSRYWIEKKKENENNIPENWLNTVSTYEYEFKEEEKYLYGALSAFVDSNQVFSLNLPSLEIDSTYRFILLSREMGMINEMEISPMDSTNHKLEKWEMKSNDIILSRDKKNYIYFFQYTVPQATSYVRFKWHGEKYDAASPDDFWVFIFKD